MSIQRIDSAAVDVWDHGDWREVAHAPAVGHERLIRLAAPVTAQRLRVRLSTPGPALTLEHVGLYRAAEENPPN